MTKITGSDLIIKCLKMYGVDTIFGIAGDHILHLLDKLIDENFRMIDGRHEAASVHMANAYSRILRKPGVVMSTTPGHANALAGLANAMHSEAPVINIAGSADSSNIGRGAMQEFDQIGIANPVTKGSWEIPSVERIPEYISLAFRTAMEGRRGPVHLTIPHDLQEAEVNEEVFIRFEKSSLDDNENWLSYPSPAQVNKCLDLLSKAKKPMVIAGLGAGATVSEKDLDEFLLNSNIPFMGVDTGRGLVKDSHPNSLGIGYIPLNRAAQRLNECDVVLLLGVKLDYQLGFGGSPPFSKEAIIISVDPEISQINRPRTVSLAINSDVGPFVENISEKSEEYEWQNLDWVKSLKETKKTYLSDMDDLADNSIPMHPMEISKAIRESIDEDTFVVFDGGDYCHYSRATIPIENYLRTMYVSSFGMIGVGLPYAIGAKAALPDKKVVLVVGDGSLGFHVPELDTSVRHDLPVTIVVGNNSLWGIDYWIQKGLYNRDVWTKLDQTNYELIAKGFGANGVIVDNPLDLKKEIQKSLNSNKISLINSIVKKISSPVADAAVTRKLGTHG
ncbi:MAG: thiamine pyrophosphate-binding protein [Chloroflexota bacterium]|nr:thiamine pyrophosphate-binding protein [Chloroflexota bacterium]